MSKQIDALEEHLIYLVNYLSNFFNRVIILYIFSKARLELAPLDDFLAHIYKEK